MYTTESTSHAINSVDSRSIVRGTRNPFLLYMAPDEGPDYSPTTYSSPIDSIVITDDSSDKEIDSSTQPSRVGSIATSDDSSDEEVDSTTQPSFVDLIEISDDGSDKEVESVFEKFATEPEDFSDLEAEMDSDIFNNLCIGDLPPGVAIRFPSINENHFPALGCQCSTCWSM